MDARPTDLSRQGVIGKDNPGLKSTSGSWPRKVANRKADSTGDLLLSPATATEAENLGRKARRFPDPPDSPSRPVPSRPDPLPGPSSSATDLAVRDLIRLLAEVNGGQARQVEREDEGRKNRLDCGKQQQPRDRHGNPRRGRRRSQNKTKPRSSTSEPPRLPLPVSADTSTGDRGKCLKSHFRLKGCEGGMFLACHGYSGARWG